MSDIKMKIVLEKNAFMPVRAHLSDAGLDLKTPYEVKIPALGSACIDTGLHVELPKGCYGKLESKSGLNIKNSIICLGGVIDEGYTGSIVVKLYNLSEKDYWFSVGDKIAQMVILQYVVPELQVVDELEETERGNNGFGSTGK